MSDSPLLVADKLSKRYDNGVLAIEELDFNVQPGECVALIGANGSGKSTLLKCLTGIESISGGSAQSLGTDLLPVGRSHRELRKLHQQIGWVFQHHGLVRRSSVLSNVVHGLLGGSGSWRAFTHQLAPSQWREGAMQALQDVGLQDTALRRADTLSGGQQQRVAVARALVRKPTLILADEPAASLDPVAGHEVMQVLTRLHNQHQCTLVFTSHDIDHARQYAKRVVGLASGRVVLDSAAGSVSETDLDSLYQRTKSNK